MKKRTSIGLTFGVFLLMVALWGAIIALANHALRAYELNPKATSPLLIAGTIYVYYKMWQWLCRRLDAIKDDR